MLAFTLALCTSHCRADETLKRLTKLFRNFGMQSSVFSFSEYINVHFSITVRKK